MTRRIDIKHYYGIILAISKQIDILKYQGGKKMTYKFPQHIDEIFKTLIVKHLKGQGLLVKRTNKNVINIEWEATK